MKCLSLLQQRIVSPIIRKPVHLQRINIHNGHIGRIPIQNAVQLHQTYQIKYPTPQPLQRRQLARSSAPPASCETPADKAKTFIITLGHEPSIAQGVIDALVSSGLSGSALLSTVRSLAGRIEVGEDAGLEALIESVKVDLARKEGKAKVQIHVVPPSAWTEPDDDDEDIVFNQEQDASMLQSSFPVVGYEGMTLTDVAKFGDDEGSSTLGEQIECACSGIMACSTCHVVVHPKWFEKVGEPNEDELDMIDLAYHPRSTSRLGCQIVLSKELEGMMVMIPKGVNNMMDYIPFED